MRRVLVLGSGGAGKSTVARSLGERLGLEVIHLDRHYWRAGWVPTPEVEWQARVRELAAGEAWVMDGNYSGTLEARLARADTAVFLDLPRLACLSGVLRRWARHRGRSRPDMPPGCPEQVDLEFLRWVWDFPRRSRPRVLERLAAAPGCRVVQLCSREATRRFLERL